MSSLSRGLYQSLITEALRDQIGALAENLKARFSALHHADAADRVALHLSQVIERLIKNMAEQERVEDAIALARKLIVTAIEETGSDFLSELPAEPGSYLTAVVALQPDGRPEQLGEPLVPLLDTTVLTNSPGEPRVGHQLVAEIPSADRIDFVMAFIRRSGIRPMMEALKRHCDAGRKLRVLTTVYTGSTEADALEDLRAIGADVRVSYDTSGTRLHAKAWLFHRMSGFSTAYVGSSNLTHSAQVSGLEWNVRLSATRNRTAVDKISAVFESYWNSVDFEPFDKVAFAEATSSSKEFTFLSPIELRPEPFQEALLEKIELSRGRGYHRNLLVSATGTGKTVMAAVDYARLRQKLPRSRLLFVAHRREILRQSIATFRHALRSGHFGELWVGGSRPKEFDHVFASIQSMHGSVLQAIEPPYFDVVIVDEFHHAEAPSYRALLEHLKPLELLGLTATPERSDGLPLLHWFDNRIAAELRLWDAIDQQRLVPFVYYGISDNLDFRAVEWRRGRGYDVEGLSNVLTANDAWARQVIHELHTKTDDVRHIRGLGFCVSIDHARFMARIFNEASIPAKAIWSDTPMSEREEALQDLAEKKINIVFSVDIFNEGVDVPSVDTLLMLRPTDSPTLFLQQLGRGLRKSHGKAFCTVLDFIGLHRQEFRFDRRFAALVGGSRAELSKQIDGGFPFLPAGCHMELDRVAAERVLNNIRSAIPTQWRRRVDELTAMSSGRRHVSLSEYLEQTGLTLEEMYSGNRGWSDLRSAAGLPVRESGPKERELRRAIGRLLHVDDADRIESYRDLLSSEAPPNVKSDSVSRTRYLRMLVASVVGNVVEASASVEEAARLLWQHPQVIAELLELLALLSSRIEHVGAVLQGHPTLPLRVHAQYTRIEIQAAFGDGTHASVPVWREGVRYIDHEKSDVFVFTLDKTSGRFSPTTRYRDYAISPTLVHWESQSTTRADGPTGRRYRSHASVGSNIMLFARRRNDDRAFYFLGPADYVSHEGEMPMAITWRLKYPLPGDLFASFAAAVA